MTNKTAPTVKKGRPLSLTATISAKLVDILRMGGTIIEACSYAGISTSTYHNHVQRSEKFTQTMAEAKHYADIRAKNLVVSSFVDDDNLESAKWWLDRRQFQKSTKIGVETQDGDKVTRVVLDIPTQD